MTEPQIAVGILSGKEIEFSFPVKFSSSVRTEISGTQKVIYQDGKIHWQGKEYDELSFIPPQNAHAFFELKDVTTIRKKDSIYKTPEMFSFLSLCLF